MATDIIKIVQQFPDVNITVNAKDLASFGDTLVTSAITRYREELEDQLRKESEDRYLSSPEAATLLGVCTRTLQRWRKSNYLNPISVGGVLRYKRSDCLAILDK